MKEFGSWKKSCRRTFGRSRGRKAQDELRDAKENKQQKEALKEPQNLPPDTCNAGVSERMEALFLPPGSEKEQNENAGAGSACNTFAKADYTETETTSPSLKKTHNLHAGFETSNLPLSSPLSDRPCSTSESGGYNDCHTQQAHSSQRQRENMSIFQTAIDAGSSIRDALDFTTSVRSANRFLPTALLPLRLPPLIASLEVLQARSRAVNTSFNLYMSEERPTFTNFHRTPRPISELDRVCVSSMTPMERKIYHRSLREWRSDLSIASQYRCGARARGPVASRHSITDRNTMGVESGGASVLESCQPSVLQDGLKQRIEESDATQGVFDNTKGVLGVSNSGQKHRYRERWATWAGLARSKFTSLRYRLRSENNRTLQPSVPISAEDGIGSDSKCVQWSRYVDGLQPAAPQPRMSTQEELHPRTATARTQGIGQAACGAGDNGDQSSEEAVPALRRKITSKRLRTAEEKTERLQKLKERLASVPQPGTNVAVEIHTIGKQTQQQESQEQIQEQEQKRNAPKIAASSSLEELLFWTELIERREAANLTAMQHKTEANLSNSTWASPPPSISRDVVQAPIMSTIEAQVASDKAQRLGSTQSAERPCSFFRNTRLQDLPHRNGEELEHIQSVAVVVKQDNNNLPLTQSKHFGVSTMSKKDHDYMTIPNLLASSISQAVDFDSDPRLEDVRNRARIMGLVHQDWLGGAAQQRMAQAPRQDDILSPLSGTIHLLSTSDAQAGRDRSQYPIQSQQ